MKIEQEPTKFHSETVGSDWLEFELGDGEEDLATTIGVNHTA